VTGYREFHDYLKSANPSQKSFDDAVQRMKQSTRQYAKRQISWIRNKLLPSIHEANIFQCSIFAYLLDGTGEHLGSLSFALAETVMTEHERSREMEFKCSGSS
jgi:tRNA dimethylallyltransferase